MLKSMLGKTNGDVKQVKRMHVSAFAVRKTIRHVECHIVRRDLFNPWWHLIISIRTLLLGEFINFNQFEYTYDIEETFKCSYSVSELQ